VELVTAAYGTHAAEARSATDWPNLGERLRQIGNPRLDGCVIRRMRAGVEPEREPWGLCTGLVAGADLLPSASTATAR
jgi:hypothetical protein